MCRLCKLAPEVEKALAADNTKVVLTFAGAPERTMSLMFHVEGGLYVVSVGGFEGLGPSGCGEEDVLKFASEVRPGVLGVGCSFAVLSPTLSGHLTDPEP